MGILDFKKDEIYKMDGQTKAVMSIMSLISLAATLGFLGVDVVLFVLTVLIVIHNSFLIAVGGLITYGIIYVIFFAVNSKISNIINARGEAASGLVIFIRKIWILFIDAVLITIMAVMAWIAYPLNPGAASLLIIIYLVMFGVGIFMCYIINKMLSNIIDDARMKYRSQQAK